MREARFDVVDMGESAWAALEPMPGEFHFEWLDHLIALLGDAGIKIVLATPVAHPPAWLDHLDVFADAGGPQTDGGYEVRSYCLNAEPLRAAVLRLLESMADHFGLNPHVLGWRLTLPADPTCACTRCHGLFLDFLQQQYGSLANLNDRLLSAGEGTTVADWGNIRIPHARHHPLLELEYRRFIETCQRQFVNEQLAALLPHLPPGVWVLNDRDYIASSLSSVAVSRDETLQSEEDNLQNYLTFTALQDLARFQHNKRLMTTGDSAGYVAHTPIRINHDLGLTRLRAWQVLAHGADAILYDCWRSTHPSPAQGSLLGPSGQTRPIYDEVRWLGLDLDRVRQLVAGSKPAAEVAILWDRESQWYVDEQQSATSISYLEHLLHFARPLARLNIPAEFVEPTAPLRPYELVLAPSLAVLAQTVVEHLKDYVRRGGHLVLSGPCGLVNEYLRPAESRPPGLLAETAGIEVEEFYRLSKPAPVNGNWFSGVAHPWAERLQTRHGNTVAVARYGLSNGWLDEQTAITVAPFGRGLVYYVGAFLDADAQHELLKRIAATAMANPLMDVPEGIEVRRRVSADRRDIWFILNHRLQEQTVTLPWPAFDHLAQRSVQQELALIPYGVALLTRQT